MIKLRQYQDDLVTALQYAIGNGKRRVCAVLGCGGGKSVIQGNIAARATSKGNRVMFIVHRKELCEQIAATFKACGVNMELCTINMVQTACRRLEKFEKPALILVDEAHHILSASYRHILDYFPNAVVVGFTATPQRMNEGGLGEVFEVLIEGKSTRWLIDNGFLTDYKPFGIQLADTSGLHTSRGDYRQEEIEALMARGAIFQDSVKAWMNLAKGKQTIVYCAGIKASKGTVAAFREAGIKAAHLDGKTPKAERAEIVEAFKRGDITVLCNVDLFGEGFDVPNCDCVVLLRPTQSLTLHIQQSMRSMRINPDNPNKVAIIIDHVGNFNRHGMPDDVRYWSLAHKGNNTEPKGVLLKTCKNCFRIVPNTTEVCPECGFVFPKQSRPDKQVVEDFELVELEKPKIPIELARLEMLPNSNYKACKTWEQLDYFRKCHKTKEGKQYSFTWALFKAEELGIPVPGNLRYTAKKRLTKKPWVYERLRFI